MSGEIKTGAGSGVFDLSDGMTGGGTTGSAAGEAAGFEFVCARKTAAGIRNPRLRLPIAR
jgi:hypothetical protein